MRLSGWTDTDLSPHGEDQVELLADHFNREHGHVDELYASPLIRARRTAEAIGALTGHTPIFLEDLRAYRERNLARGGMSGLFPVWKRDTSQFARDVIGRGFKSYLSCVEGKVGQGFVGRPGGRFGYISVRKSL